MALNYIWIGFFVVAFAVGLVKLLFFGDTDVFAAMMDSTFDMAKTGFETSLGLTGVLALWMGIMKIGEKGGAVRLFAYAVRPFFRRLFPELGKDHPAHAAIAMNIAANMLNLDNAATPMGLQAMKAMQDSNPNKDTASNAQIMFLVLNTSGLTLLPISIMAFRGQLGAADPGDVFIPILIATFFSTLVGLLIVAAYQRINLLDRVVLSYIGGMCLFIGTIIWGLAGRSKDEIAIISKVTGNIILFSVIILFLALGVWRKVNVYDAFIEGAKDGFGVAVKIIPYLVGILVAIGLFRASGAMTWVVDGTGWCFAKLGINTDFVGALPTAFMRPLSGNGARAMMVDTMSTFGADSFVGRVASVIQGSTDTTFYILAVYFGSVGIKRTRYAVTCGLLADFAGVAAAIFICYLYFPR
ncbi:MAG: spore maturation protein [Bacteroidales bacterium]|jgi:spore maturation protein SpmA/spore maturation protein SpmB|nr:spore maturation protein [Bacteroidales bacterium]